MPSYDPRSESEPSTLSLAVGSRTPRKRGFTSLTLGALAFVALGTALAAALPGCSGSSDGATVTPETPDAAADGASAIPTGSTTGSTSPDAAPEPSGTYFPPANGAGAWATVDPTAAGWDAKALSDVKDWIGQTNGTSFLVLADGKILIEAYWTSDETTLRDIASAQKSIVSLLTGIAMSGGSFKDADTVSSHVPAGWTNDTPANESAITVRQLLTMTSGLDDNLMRVAEPGSTWRYNTNAYHCLEGVLEAKTGKSLQDFTRSALFDRIGAGASAWTTRQLQKDGKGQPIHALEMTARDMARVGLLVQAKGAWNGTPIVPSSYLTVALDTSQTLNPSYGLLWWLNGKSSYLLPPSQPGTGPLMPSAPVDLVAALGAADQKIYVARSQKLVVIRQGKAASQGTQALSNFDDELWKRLFAAKKAK